MISPILANLFLHYAFDMWMARTLPAVPFERYADDAICHCRTREEAEALRAALEERLAACRLVLHPQKTRIVYCKDTNRGGTYPDVTFDFLGYTFRPRLAAWRGGKYGVSFLPAAADEALKEIRRASGAGASRTGPTRPSMIWPGCSAPTSEAGSATTATSTSRRW